MYKVKDAVETLFVNSFIDGILDPEKEMLGPVKDGGHIIANTAPGCWGPMIYVEGAEVGDAIVVNIKSIHVTSLATASGNDQSVEGRFLGDPFVAVKCSGCGTLYPETVIKGIGQEAIRCATCDSDITPFVFTNGYTITFGEEGDVGITVPKEAAEKIARDGRH